MFSKSAMDLKPSLPILQPSISILITELLKRRHSQSFEVLLSLNFKELPGSKCIHCKDDCVLMASQ